MSKEFKGTHWQITVDDEGHFHFNKSFWYSVGVMGVSYAGSLSALTPLFSLTFKHQKPLKSFFTMLLRGVPLQAAVLKLTSESLAMFGRLDKEDIKAFGDAIEYAKKIREAVSDNSDDGVYDNATNVKKAVEDLVDSFMKTNASDTAKEEVRKKMEEVDLLYNKLKNIHDGDNKEEE